MPTKTDLDLFENNDEVLHCTVSATDPTFVLTGKTVEVVFKQSPTKADDDPSSTLLSTVTGEVTIVDASKFDVNVPAAAMVTAIKWWRGDVLAGTARKTAVYGAVKVTDT